MTGTRQEPAGALVTLAELKAFGRFVRWQDMDAAVQPLVARNGPFAYPLLPWRPSPDPTIERCIDGVWHEPPPPSRLPPEPAIDLCIEGIWRRLTTFALEWSEAGLRVLYEYHGRSGDVRCMADRTWYDVAPAGYFTDRIVLEPPGFDAGAAEIVRETFRPRHRDHVIAVQRVAEVRWPYLTFDVATCHRSDGYDERHAPHETPTFHVADPRIRVPGVAATPPYCNAPIAVSHRWLSATHPDPAGTQLRELLRVCDALRLHDRQAFLIDYCTLPQEPRDAAEDAIFARDWPGFQRSFCGDVIVLTTGAADYATRAWCMLELVCASLSAVGGRVLNHDRLDERLGAARREAAGFVQNLTYLRGAVALPSEGGDATALLAELRDPQKRMIYNAVLKQRTQILDRFAGDEFKLRHPDDRRLVLRMVRDLVRLARDAAA